MKGDRGGPLGLRGENGRWVLIGVASFFASVGCQPAYPDGFTRVSYYTDWISSTIANNNNNDDQYSLVGDLKPWTEKPANILIKQTNSIKVENIDNDNRITPKPTGISYFFNNGIYNWRKSTSGLLFQTMTASTRNYIQFDYLKYKMHFLNDFFQQPTSPPLNLPLKCPPNYLAVVIVPTEISTPIPMLATRSTCVQEDTSTFM